jgi:hypothetical protein
MTPPIRPMTANTIQVSQKMIGSCTGSFALKFGPWFALKPHSIAAVAVFTDPTIRASTDPTITLIFEFMGHLLLCEPVPLHLSEPIVVRLCRPSQKGGFSHLCGFRLMPAEYGLACES